MAIEMRLVRIIISEINDNQAIYLQEVDGERQLPISIGIFEATSIDRRVKQAPRLRPLTHDLIVSIVESLGGELDSVWIHEFRNETFFAKLRIRRDGEIIEIDSRPSDAIAVAFCCNPILPIFVEEQVLETISSPPF